MTAASGSDPATAVRRAGQAEGGRPSPATRNRSAFVPLRVVRVDRLCDDAAALTLAVPPPHADDFAFRAGQSLTLRRTVDGREERRSYSICSPFGGALRIGVREVPGGKLSSWLVREVGRGDVVESLRPAGSFTPDLGRPGRHALVAAGSGITPVLSIAASVLADGRSEATLVYANRRAESVMFVDEVADLKDAHPDRVSVVHVLSREAQEVELFSGRLDAGRLRRLLPVVTAPATVDHWWLCGPHGMVGAALDVLRELGVPRERVHRELFHVEPEPPSPVLHAERASSGARVTVVLDGRATSVVVPAGVSVLDAAQAARPDLPFACRGGVCGTCRARVVDGEVSMRRNFALEPGEVQAGFVLTCQALPASPTATLDYDA